MTVQRAASLLDFSDLRQMVIDAADRYVAALAGAPAGHYTEALRDKQAILRLRQLVETFDPARPYSVRPAGAEKTLRFIVQSLTRKEVDWLRENATMHHTKGENMFVFVARAERRDETVRSLQAAHAWGDMATAMFAEWPEEANGERWLWIWDL